MKFVLTVTGVLAFVLCFAQTHSTPAQLVNTAKTKGQIFEPTSLFSVAPSSNSEITRQLSDYQTLQLDEEALAQLLLKRTQTIELTLPDAGRGTNLNLKLVQVNPLSAAFTAVLASSERATKVKQGIHYRGIIEGRAGSVAAISLFEGQVMGLFSAPDLGNLVLGSIEGARHTGQYVIYQDKDIMNTLDFECSTSDEGPDYRADQLEAPAGTQSIDKCVNIYLEIDHDVFQDKGGVDATTTYITGLFNQVASLYANENVNIRLSEILIWDTPSPYYGTNSYTLLTQFVSERPSFNGDLGQLISYQASGGIAYLAGLCSNYSPKHSFSSINSYYSSVPTYSFSVMVITHELGHLMGSRHTHACVWNGNNTAIDGCAGYAEGNCPTPGYPAEGGTIMSYCHLRNVGINFSFGFGTQPGNVVRNTVTNASCLNICDDGGDENGGCDGQEVNLRIVLDQYGLETSWEIRDTNDAVIHAGGPYPNTSNGSVITRSLCLKEGCYTFEIYDEFGDGICCDFGDGYYELSDTNNIILAEGDAFTYSEITDFCIPTATDSTDCTTINFAEHEIVSYGGAQDAGVHLLLQDQTELGIFGNAWKAIDFEYEVSSETMLEFEFKSTIQGEIHGIGFDNNNAISANRTFRLYGIQNWGYSDYDHYQPEEGWQTFTIPVGAFYTGRFERLFFVADHDRSPGNGNAYFRNIKIYEGGGCSDDVIDQLIINKLAQDKNEAATQLLVFPNPVREVLTLDYFTPQAGQVRFDIYNTTAQLIYSKQIDVLSGHQRHQMNVGAWKSGTYILKMSTPGEQLVKRIVVSSN